MRYSIWDGRHLVVADVSRALAIDELRRLLPRADVEALLVRVDASPLALEYAGVVIQMAHSCDDEPDAA